MQRMHASPTTAGHFHDGAGQRLLYMHNVIQASSHQVTQAIYPCPVVVHHNALEQLSGAKGVRWHASKLWPSLQDLALCQLVQLLDGLCDQLLLVAADGAAAPAAGHRQPAPSAANCMDSAKKSPSTEPKTQSWPDENLQHAQQQPTGIPWKSKEFTSSTQGATQKKPSSLRLYACRLCA